MVGKTIFYFSINVLSRIIVRFDIKLFTRLRDRKTYVKSKVMFKMSTNHNKIVARSIVIDCFRTYRTNCFDSIGRKDNNDLCPSRQSSRVCVLHFFFYKIKFLVEFKRLCMSQSERKRE